MRANPFSERLNDFLERFYSAKAEMINHSYTAGDAIQGNSLRLVARRVGEISPDKDFLTCLFALREGLCRTYAAFHAQSQSKDPKIYTKRPIMRHVDQTSSEKIIPSDCFFNAYFFQNFAQTHFLDSVSKNFRVMDDLFNALIQFAKQENTDPVCVNKERHEELSDCYARGFLNLFMNAISSTKPVITKIHLKKHAATLFKINYHFRTDEIKEYCGTVWVNSETSEISDAEIKEYVMRAASFDAAGCSDLSPHYFVVRKNNGRKLESKNSAFTLFPHPFAKENTQLKIGPGL